MMKAIRTLTLWIIGIVGLLYLIGWACGRKLNNDKI